MVWQLTAEQYFFIAILAFAVLGFRRGWRREIISLAFILTGRLFLIFGSLSLAQFVFVKLSRAIQILFTGAAPAQPAETLRSNDPRVAISTVLAFIIFVALGYLVSNRVGPKPTVAPERIWGVIPAIIAGYAILTFIPGAFGSIPPFTIGVSTPTQGLISSYLLVIFIVIVVAVIVPLIAASAKKKSSPPKKS